MGDTNSWWRDVSPASLQQFKCWLRWFCHVSRMPQKRLSKQALLAKGYCRRPVGRPRTRWTDYIEGLKWMWWKTVRCGGLILSYCPRNPHGEAGNEERRRRQLFKTCKDVAAGWFSLANRVQPVGCTLPTPPIVGCGAKMQQVFKNITFWYKPWIREC